VGLSGDGVAAVGDNYDILGGAICGLFLVVGVASILYRRHELRRRLAETCALEPVSDVEQARDGSGDGG